VGKKRVRERVDGLTPGGELQPEKPTYDEGKISKRGRGTTPVPNRGDCPSRGSTKKVPRRGGTTRLPKVPSPKRGVSSGGQKPLCIGKKGKTYHGITKGGNPHTHTTTKKGKRKMRGVTVVPRTAGFTEREKKSQSQKGQAAIKPKNIEEKRGTGLQEKMGTKNRKTKTLGDQSDIVPGESSTHDTGITNKSAKAGFKQKWKMR